MDLDLGLPAERRLRAGEDHGGAGGGVGDQLKKERKGKERVFFFPGGRSKARAAAGSSCSLVLSLDSFFFLFYFYL